MKTRTLDQLDFTVRLLADHLVEGRQPEAAEAYARVRQLITEAIAERDALLGMVPRPDLLADIAAQYVAPES